MANSPTETLIGAGVLLAAAGFLFYSSQTIGLTAGASDQYNLTASFNSVEGLNVGTEVRMAGVRIGTVADMRLNTETFQADTIFAIDDPILIPDDSDVKVASEGLLGGSFVEITPGASEFMFADGDEIIYTQSAVSFISLLLKFATNGAEE